MNVNKAAWVEISGDALAYNLETIRSRVKEGTRICAVIKGNAYGHGLTGIKKILSERGLAEMSAVGKSSELLRILRKTEDDGCDVLLLGMADEKEIESLLIRAGEKASRAVFSAYSLSHFRKLNDLGIKRGEKIRVHIRVDIWDSGMGMGFKQFLQYEDELFSMEGIDVCGLYAHLYSAYYDENREETEKELKEFDHLVNSLRPAHRKKIIVHVMNSSMVFSFPEYAYDMVRAGTGMYGLTCGDGGCLKPVMKICARIFDVREIDADTPLSYGHSNSNIRKRKIARAMIGYCDCPMLLTQKDVRVRIGDQIFPLADEICMDNLCIDVTGCDNVAVGDTAVLLGEPGVTDKEILVRNDLDYVHSDWLSMTAERLEKVYV